MVASDKGLSEVLRKHREKIGEEHIIDDEPVVCADGSRGIVDLMLSRSVPQPNARKHEHLIIELKRPSVVIDDAARSQAMKYALAIAGDERFKDTDTYWEFWLLSNELSAGIQAEATQVNRPTGLLYEGPRIKIWAKRWSTVLDEAKARLRHYKDSLDLEFSSADGLAHLRRLYEKYVPVIQQDAASGTGNSPPVASAPSVAPTQPPSAAVPPTEAS